MYCKNCGSEIEDIAAVCIHCGVAVGNGTKFCHHCGSKMPEGADFCIRCGASVKGAKAIDSQPGTAKSRIVAGVLAILLGELGVHNFYLGFNKRAMAQLLITVLSLGSLSIVSFIWGLVEGIYYLTKKENYTTDADGVPLTD